MQYTSKLDFLLSLDKIRLQIHELNTCQNPVKLHIGCGTAYKNGWINIDNNTDNNIQKLDFNWDLRHSLPIDDNCVDFIYCEHFLEHLTVTEGQTFLKDMFRILKPKGVMRIAVPDLESTVAMYMNPHWKEDCHDFFEKFQLNFIQTRAELINISFRAWGHKWLYDWEELERRLIEAGGKNISQAIIFTSSYSELCNLESREESTLIAEVQK